MILSFLHKAKNKFMAYHLFFVIAILIHLFYFFTSILYGDEIVSIFYANSYKWPYFLTNLIEITNPNTYYLFLKVLFAVTDSIIIIKIIHVLFIFVSMFFIYKTAELLLPQLRDRLYFVLPFLSSLYFIRFGSMIRMYGIGIMILSISIFFTLRFLLTRVRKDFIISALIDIMGILFVYGYSLWIAMKLIFFIRSYFEERSNILLLQLLYTILIIVSFIFYIFSLFINDKFGFQTHLSWVGSPNLYDLGLMFLSLNGINYFGYFEGLDKISQNSEFLGNAFGFSVIILCIVMIHKLSFSFSSNERVKKIVTDIFLLNNSLLISIFLFSVAVKPYFFHVRQLFVIAVIYSICFGYFLSSVKTKVVKVTLSALILLYSLLNIQSIYYPKFIIPQRSSGEWLIIEEQHTEIGYYLCDARSYSDIFQNCPKEDIAFSIDEYQLSVKDIQRNIYLSEEQYNTYKSLVICSEKIGNFFKCKLHVE